MDIVVITLLVLTTISIILISTLMFFYLRYGVLLPSPKKLVLIDKPYNPSLNTTLKTIDLENIDKGHKNIPVSFTYEFVIDVQAFENINDDYRTLFSRGNGSSIKDQNMIVYLTDNTHSLGVAFRTIEEANETGTLKEMLQPSKKYFVTTTVSGFPLYHPVHVVITVKDMRMVEIYVNGQLVRVEDISALALANEQTLNRHDGLLMQIAPSFNNGSLGMNFHMMWLYYFKTNVTQQWVSREFKKFHRITQTQKREKSLRIFCTGT